MLRVDNNELVLADDELPFQDVSYGGAPFTGIGVTTTAHTTCEHRYQAGFGHGRCIITSVSGQLLDEFVLERGNFVGERRTWFSSGGLRGRTMFGPPRRDEIWNEAGQLVEFVDAATRARRRWYDDGTLRSEQLADNHREFAPSGRLAFTWTPRTILDVPHARHRFVADVMHAEFDKLLAEPTREHHVFMWIHALLDASRTDGVAVLRRILAGDDLWAISTAIAIVGNALLTEFLPDLQAFAQDQRIPPTMRHGQGSRMATLSLGVNAVNAIARLVAVDAIARLVAVNE